MKIIQNLMCSMNNQEVLVIKDDKIDINIDFIANTKKKKI